MMPEPEVRPEARPVPKRRTFTSKYKLRILAESSQKPGEIGALLRREGLYSSNLTEWRRERAAGELKAGVVKARGRKAAPEAQEMARLRSENERLRRRLEQAELLIDAQKKLALALENALTDRSGSSS
jgi:transposase-like protein